MARGDLRIVRPAPSLDDLPEVLTVEEAAAVLRIGRGNAYEPRKFSGVDLKTRGFLNNDCLAQLMYPCMSNAGGYRPEATAQARALQELSGLVPYIPAPVSAEVETDPGGAVDPNERGRPDRQLCNSDTAL